MVEPDSYEFGAGSQCVLPLGRRMHMLQCWPAPLPTGMASSDASPLPPCGQWYGDGWFYDVALPRTACGMGMGGLCHIRTYRWMLKAVPFVKNKAIPCRNALG